MTGQSSEPLVSFVVPCYNYGRFLPDCLNSIFRQEGDYSFEVIAIDDASTDDTAQVLERIRDPRLRVLRHAVNQGHVRTISDGLLAARGKLVARIDPDDRYRHSFLRETVPLFEQYPDVGFVHGGVEVIDTEGNLTDAGIRSPQGRNASKGNVYVQLLEQNSVAAATVIARREMWLGTLPVPPDLSFTDWYYNLMMARRCEFYFVPQVLAEYRIHGANHHMRILHDKTWETGVVSILDRLFSETETSPELEKAKQSARDRIYGAHFWEFANQYYGAGFFSDARRCYFKTLRYRPAKAVSALSCRLLLASLIGKRAYDALKSMRGHAC